MNRTDDECYTGTGPAAEVANGWGKPCYSDVAAHAGQTNQGQPTYAELLAQRDELAAALRGMLNIVNDSRGVAGYHLNGAVADWSEFEEVDAASAAISRIKGA
jgi:hypothetical protein